MSASVALLEEQLEHLNGEIRELAQEVKQLYDKVSEADNKEREQKLYHRIDKLEKKEENLFKERRDIEAKLASGIDPGTRRINLSAIGPTEFAEMGSKGGLACTIVEIPLLGRKGGTESFRWDDQLEKAQADRYMPHLKKLISVPGDARWVEAANCHPSMLSTDSEAAFGKNVRGTTDVAICTRTSVLTYSPQMGIRIALQLKKRLDSAAIAQARATLILANFHAPQVKPIVVLSDLNDEWILFWLNSKTVCQAFLESRAQAAAYIQSFLSGDLASPEPNSDEVDINARSAIPEAILHAHVMDATLYSEQLETLEAAGTAEDVRQWKLQRLMNLVYADPRRPSWTPA